MLANEACSYIPYFPHGMVTVENARRSTVTVALDCNVVPSFGNSIRHFISVERFEPRPKLLNVAEDVRVIVRVN